MIIMRLMPREIPYGEDRHRKDQQERRYADHNDSHRGTAALSDLGKLSEGEHNLREGAHLRRFSRLQELSSRNG